MWFLSDFSMMKNDCFYMISWLLWRGVLTKVVVRWMETNIFKYKTWLNYFIFSSFFHFDKSLISQTGGCPLGMWFLGDFSMMKNDWFHMISWLLWRGVRRKVVVRRKENNIFKYTTWLNYFIFSSFFLLGKPNFTNWGVSSWHVVSQRFLNDEKTDRFGVILWW